MPCADGGLLARIYLNGPQTAGFWLPGLNLTRLPGGPIGRTPQLFSAPPSTNRCLEPMSDELEPFPSARLRDHARTGFQAGVSALPFGGTVNNLINAVVAPSFERRRERWFKKLAEVVEEVNSRVDDFDLEQLADNELFVTAVFEASRIATVTHLDEKLDLLKNVLVRLAVDTDSDDFLALQMLRFVDTLTPEHFLVLRYCSDPEGWFDAMGIGRPNLYMGSPGSLMHSAQLPVVGTSRDIVLRDLSDHGLANTQSLNTTMTEAGAWGPLATDLGNALLKFVSDTAQD